MSEMEAQLEHDDAVLAEIVERLGVLAGPSGVTLGVTWREHIARLTRDQLLDLLLATRRALRRQG